MRVYSEHTAGHHNTRDTTRHFSKHLQQAPRRLVSEWLPYLLLHAVSEPACNGSLGTANERHAGISLELPLPLHSSFSRATAHTFATTASSYRWSGLYYALSFQHPLFNKISGLLT
jgi:hypothetical protein